MINKLSRFYFACSEKKKLYHFVKDIFYLKKQEIEDALIINYDLEYAVQVLENCRYLSPELGKELAKTAKAIFSNHDLTRLNDASLAVKIIGAVHPYFEETDAYILDEIYQLYKKHSYLFDKKLIDRLEYYYYTLESKFQFGEPIQLVAQTENFINTRMYTPIAFDLYNMTPQPFWNVTIRHDPDTQTSVSTMTHRIGKNLRVQGIFENDFDDLTRMKTLLQEKQFDVIFMNIAPYEKVNKTNLLDSITQKLENNQPFKQEQKEVFLNDLKEVVDSYKGKYQFIETKTIVSGIKQGFEVPFLYQSLLYTLSKQDKQPIVICSGQNNEEKVRMFLNTIKTKDVLKELQLLRMKWLNEVMEWISEVQKIGCFTCSTQAQGCRAPSQILDRHKVMMEEQAKFTAKVVLNYMGGSGKKNFLLLCQESQFYETVKQLVQGGLENEEQDIDEVREKMQQEYAKGQNQKHLDTFIKFYQDKEHFDRIYKYCEQDILDLNKYSKAKYKKGIQLRCGARELLF